MLKWLSGIVCIAGFVGCVAAYGPTRAEWSSVGKTCWRFHRSLEIAVDDPDRAVLVGLGRIDPETPPPPGQFVTPLIERWLWVALWYLVILGLSILLLQTLVYYLQEGYRWWQLCWGGNSHPKLFPPVWVSRRLDELFGCVFLGTVLAFFARFPMSYGERWVFSPHGIPVSVVASDGRHHADGKPMDAFVQKWVAAGTEEIWMAFIFGGGGILILTAWASTSRELDEQYRHRIILRLEEIIEGASAAERRTPQFEALLEIYAEHLDFLRREGELGLWSWYFQRPRLPRKLPNSPRTLRSP